MPSNVFSTMAARAKAHHESMNAAFEATYSPRVSTSSNTPPNSRKASVSSEAPQSDRNITKAWKAIKKNHADMNEAYETFYSQARYTPGTSRSGSFEEARVAHEEAAQEPRNYQKAWKALKGRAVEHHKSVNSAFAAAHGGGLRIARE
jgi:plasmid stability protein